MAVELFYVVALFWIIAMAIKGQIAWCKEIAAAWRQARRLQKRKI